MDSSTVNPALNSTETVHEVSPSQESDTGTSTPQNPFPKKNIDMSKVLLEAIEKIQNSDGADFAEIKKFIVSNFTTTDSDNSRKLKAALKKAYEDGLVKKTGGKYKVVTKNSRASRSQAKVLRGRKQSQKRKSTSKKRVAKKRGAQGRSKSNLRSKSKKPRSTKRPASKRRISKPPERSRISRR